MTFIPLRLAAAAALTVASLASGAQAATVLDVTQYNGFFLGSYEGVNSDVEGALAAGGTVKLTSYGVGSNLDGKANGTNTLIVGGDLNVSDGQLFFGNAKVGGTVKNTGFNFQNGTVETGVNFDFASTGAALKQTAASLSQYSGVDVTTTEWGTLKLQGSEAGLNVFNITADLLRSSHTLQILTPNNAQVLVNVSGDAATWQNMGVFLNGTPTTNVLFNFYEATNLNLAGISINGSILAPNAHIEFNSGHINGLLIGGSFKGGGELHNTGYTGNLLTPNTPVTPGVPEPTTWALMLVGFGVVGAAMRKRRKAVNNGPAFA